MSNFLVGLLKRNNCRFSSVLDIGCGVTANELHNLASIYKEKDVFNLGKIVGIDKMCSSRIEMINSFIFACGGGNLRQFENDNNILFSRVDITSNDLPYDTFGLIILSNILHLLEFHKAKKVYSSAIDILKPGGFMFIQLANENHDLLSGPKWKMSEKELDNLSTLNIIDKGSFDYTRYTLLQKE
ncbi:class I SAM-dependent methyltransferase [Fulvivirga sp. RKSG066]|uniref:class I SAM-dependent methyltransferase n=1 Tax=Fulvivirga aurantia TaxID=2529383 RepID=UPI0012BD6105|nr:class I SAM-dependent methyltransferase [Fulvivirga aurantia]MTI20105.1 class I SAM-dependent methyltransferase [Fulvivirga aurantia]